jgi:hypothetical protein
MTDDVILSPKTKLQLEELAHEIIQIKKTLRLGTTSLTPLNYMEEMEKFFTSQKYNPQYIYKEQDLPNFTEIIDEFKRKVEKLVLPEDLAQHILEFLDDQNSLYLTKKSVGTSEFSENAHNLFDWGSDRLDMLLANTPAVEFTMHIKHKIQDAEYIKKKVSKSIGAIQN